MKRILFTLALALGLAVSAKAQYFQTPAANTVYFGQEDPFFGGFLGNWVPLPASGTQGLYVFDSTTYAGGQVGVVSATMGNQLVYAFDTMTGTATLNAANADWSAATGTKGAILNKPVIPSTESGTVTTDSSGNVTWTYPTAYPAGTVPKCSCLPHGTTATNVTAQWISATNTSVTFKVWSLPQTSVLGIVVLGAPAGAASLVCDVIATA